MLAAILPRPALATDGAVQASYSESNGCGVPRSFAPLATGAGGLIDAEPIRGPFGALFGRTVGQARSALVRWAVPFAGGLTVSVHQRALPAFQQVAANLAATGAHYPTRGGETYGFTARTVAGSRSISYHAMGAAVDVNSRTNPAHASLLITDMPPWYVEAWERAGFCWGGDWLGSKDPMHYSWMGPVATPGYGPTPVPYPSLAAPAGFTDVPAAYQSALGARRGGGADALADLTGDGALDAVRVTTHSSAGPIVEVMGSWADFGSCGFSRFQLPGADPAQPVIFGNTTFGGRADIAFLDFSGPSLVLRIHEAATFYQSARVVPTAAAAQPLASHVLADYDFDGRDDLLIVYQGLLQVWDGATGFTTLEASLPVAVPAGARVMGSDRDLDGRPDLYALSPDGTLQIFTAATGYAGVAESASVPLGFGAGDEVAIGDLDGEGHADIYRLDGSGRIVVALGNRQIFPDLDGWYRSPDFTCAPGSVPPYDFDGRFADDDGNAFEADIEWAAAAGITLGCNPPFNDWFCPGLTVTRGQMAAFLVRARGLPAAVADAFSDDNGSAFEADINRLAAAGITTGCGPGMFCPEQPVTREQMATFLVRAFAIPPGPTGPFSDVAGLHAADVAALYAAGITGGCSTAPPAYCPTAPVLREQMAAFLSRASS